MTHWSQIAQESHEMVECRVKTPVAFIIFNRPDTTACVFAEIVRAKPLKLLVIADGPRPHRDGEVERCAETRAIIDRVDWDCEVLTNYSGINLGCKNRVASGINWVFEQVPEAIILEDDCLPDPTFFRFCEELLARYRDDERISMIGGANFQFGRRRTEASYYFSRYNHVWGWASWRRAWRHYNPCAVAWPALRDGGWLQTLIHSADERRYWSSAFQAVYDEKIDTWDYQWNLAAWIQGMVAVVPETNLISNIGFGAGATHTNSASIFAAIQTGSMTFPLRHPDSMLPHSVADEFTARSMFISSKPRRVLRKLRGMFGPIKVLQ